MGSVGLCQAHLVVIPLHSGSYCVERWVRDQGELIAEAARLLCPFEQTLVHGGPFLFGTARVYSDFLLFGILENFTFRDAAPFPPDFPEHGANA